MLVSDTGMSPILGRVYYSKNPMHKSLNIAMVIWEKNTIKLDIL